MITCLTGLFSTYNKNDQDFPPNVPFLQISRVNKKVISNELGMSNMPQVGLPEQGIPPVPIRPSSITITKMMQSEAETIRNRLL